MPQALAVVLTLLMAVMVLLLFMVGSRGRIDLRWGAAFALVAAIALYLLAMVLRLYVDAAPNMSQLYGTAAGVVAGMLAAYAGAFVVLVSALAARVGGQMRADTLRP